MSCKIVNFTSLFTNKFWEVFTSIFHDQIVYYMRFKGDIKLCEDCAKLDNRFEETIYEIHIFQKNFYLKKFFLL